MHATLIARLGPARSRFTSFDGSVPAGFPSPASDYEALCLSIDELVGLRAPHTYLVRAAGDSMVEAGIHDGDVLVVDRSLQAREGCIVIAHVLGDMTVKTLARDGSGQLLLMPANPRYQPIPVDPDALEIWGVVTCNLHFHKRP